MINPVLERRFADCTELVEAWKSYLDYFHEAVKTEEFESTPSKEQSFLDCKARIAMLHDSFMESLKHDQSVGQNMLSIVNRSITLRHLRKAGAADQKKIEIEWNEVYLLLNETVSNLGDQRERLANVNELSYKMGKVKARTMTNLKSFMRSVWFKIIFSIVILLLIVFGVPAFGIYDWDNLRSVGAVGKPYAAFVDARRDILGISGEFSSIEKYMDSVVADAPSDYTVKTAEAEKSGAASSFNDAFEVNGKDAGDVLRSATAFASRNVIIEENGRQMTAYIFFWFDGDDAYNFRRAFEDATTDSSNITARSLGNIYSATNYENVLVLLTGTQQERETALIRVFK